MLFALLNHDHESQTGSKTGNFYVSLLFEGTVPRGPAFKLLLLSVQQLFDSCVLSMFVKLSQQSIISVTIVWSSQYSMNRGNLTTASQDNFSFDSMNCTFLFVLNAFIASTCEMQAKFFMFTMILMKTMSQTMKF